MIRINQVKIRPDHSMDQLKHKIAEILRVRDSEILSFLIVRRSIDARKKPDIFYSYTVDVLLKNEGKIIAGNKAQKSAKNGQISLAETVRYHFPEQTGKPSMEPVIVGTGPAGLFCGYFLALGGYRPILLERGADADTRVRDVEDFWQGGPLKADSNVQFGEGGAGTFSDGKLNTLIKDRDGRGRAVLETFVRFGADESILYDSKPHIGTDILCSVVKRMREEIISLGGTVRFHSKVTDIVGEKDRVEGVIINGQEFLPCRQLVLAVGHSARDTFSMFYRKRIAMEAKAFAVGLRVEHLQSLINVSQYGMSDPGSLGAAPYKLAAQTSTGRSVYSFCMCPGGYVVNASSEPGRLAINGMSYSSRSGINANSAIIVSVTPKDFGSSHPLAGIEFQRLLEERAFALGGGRIPVQHYGEFRDCVEAGEGKQSEGCGQASRQLWQSKGCGQAARQLRQSGDQDIKCPKMQPQMKGGFVYADVNSILPPSCNLAFVEGMERFGRQIKGFDHDDVLLSGVESRTSSPVRILRDADLQSSMKGIYPCGEGAGYAGGITSAAMDGIKVAEIVALTQEKL